jgi:3-phosphoshikimate 1-carboxyvinyltransferase
MIREFNSVNKIRGTIYLPGDKSISHRAVMFASLAKGRSVIQNCLNAHDVNSTIQCFRQLGCIIERSGDTVIIDGLGFKNFKKPGTALYAGNSGTTSRLISGILCAQDFETVLTGDESLSIRPMKRIIEPLSYMGAEIEASGKFTLPLIIRPSENLHAVQYEMQVASAQVKSTILLAGLHLDAITTVTEKEKTRNHTENLLNLFVEEGEGKRIISVSKKNYPANFEMTVPSDISSAAFFIVFALLVPGAELVLENVLLNATRTGILQVLKKMGADIRVEDIKISNGEKAGTLVIRNSRLQNCVIEKELIPNIIDEIPILSVAGLFAEGKFEIRNAAELRFKESDRIRALCENYKYLGLEVEEFDDGFSIEGEMTDRNFIFESFNDHRIAMTFAILSMLRKNGGKVNNFECIEISNPAFLSQLGKII